ncbi:Fc.00g075910.m01.CDS01 [Cosmosporella sp. VM-42]
MVYCGKASQGCQSCRTRRIKCDKVRPECSQCIRVGKKCPGYRDQLSLMFRDESSKVIQKAHAQWGVGDAPETPYPQSTSSSYTTASSLSTSSSIASWSNSPFSAASQRPSPPSPPSPPSSHRSSPSYTAAWPAVQFPTRLPSPIDPSLEDQGVQFYVNRYLIGHPDEPKTIRDLSDAQWMASPALQDIMTAVGLASISNLRDDPKLMVSARQKYGSALRRTGELIKTSAMPSFDVTMRAIVMLAMFELVKGAQKGMDIVQIHVMGGVALLRSWCPMPGTPFSGVRSLIQLCYCMFIPAHLAGIPLAAPFYEWVEFSRSLLEPADHPATDLGILIAQFVQLSAYVQSHDLGDGLRKATSTLQQLLEADTAFATWERGLGEIWHYRTEDAEHLPPAAVFEGEYHGYYDMWVARIWAHYRWARILLNQTILDFAGTHPVSSKSLVSGAERNRRLEIIRKHAKDMLVSTPSHWRHPLLDDKSQVPVEQDGGAGSGAAGLPVLLYQMKVAACAPGIPATYWKWAHGVMECIWGDLGMLHAKFMMEEMEAYRDDLRDDQTIKVASKKDAKGAKIKLKKLPPKHSNPGNWRDGSVIQGLAEDKKKNGASPSTSATSPGPVVNQLDDTARETFATGRPLEDSPDLQQCKHCKKSILKTAAKAHIAQCLRLKKEKAQRKKEAREARERAKEAAREEEQRKHDVENGDAKGDDDSDGDEGIAAEKKPTGSKTAKKAAGKKPDDDKKGKKRKADGDPDKAPKSKKKKDEPKAKVPKPKGPVDVERQCGVILPNGQPCARSLTCKSHSMGAKRAVAGRSLPYDMLLAAYQKKNQAKQQKAALDANAPVEDEDDVNNGPVDLDEETAAVMGALAHWNPQPLMPQPTFTPIKRQYQLARLHEQLQMATNGGRMNIFQVVGYGAQKLPEGHPGLLDSEDAPGEPDLGVVGFGNPSRTPSNFGLPGPPSRRTSVTGRA